MSQKVDYFPRPAAPGVAPLNVEFCGTNSILGSYHRQFTFQGVMPPKVVVNIRHVMAHVDLAAEMASAREELGLTEDQLVLGVIEEDFRDLVAA